MTASLLRRYSHSVRTATRSRTTLFLLALAAGCSFATAPVYSQDDPASSIERKVPVPRPEAPKPAGEEIVATTPGDDDARALVEQLDADDYDDRERAMTRLVQAGPAAIDPLVARLPDGSREMIARGLYVLVRLALSEDPSIADRSRAAMETFAEDPNSPLGRQAELAIDDLDSKLLEQTVARLRDLGATVAMDVTSVGGLLKENVQSISLDQEAWKGTDQDLELIGRLGEATEVRIEGERFGDAAIRAVAGLDDLETLTIKKAKLSREGLAPLEKAESLTTLRILYCGGDDSIDAIEKLKSLSMLQLFGTKLSDEGEERLRTMFADRAQGALDIRRGGFLGVRGASIQEGALVTDVVPGSAAAEAGMRPGDVIVGIDDKPAKDFEQVLEHIGGFLPGREIKFAVLRGGERIEAKASLGEWE